MLSSAEMFNAMTAGDRFWLWLNRAYERLTPCPGCGHPFSAHFYTGDCATCGEGDPCGF